MGFLYLTLWGGTLAAEFVPNLALLTHGLLVVVVAAALSLAGKRKVPLAPGEGWAFLFLLVTLLSTFNSLYPRISWDLWFHTLLSVGVWVSVARLARCSSAREPLYLALFGGVMGVALSGLAQVLHPPPLEQARYFTETFQPRVYATMNQPNNLAGFLTLTFPFGAAYVAVQPFRRRQILLWPLLLLLAYILLKTYSRGGLLSFAVGLLLFAGFIGGESVRRWHHAHPLRIWALMAGGLVLAGLLLYLTRESPLTRRFLLLSDWQHYTTQERAFMWATTWRMIEQRPLLGWGPGTYWLVYPNLRGLHPLLWSPLYTHAHNVYLQMASERGLVSLALFGVLIGVVLRRGWQVRREVHGQEFWLLSGLLAGLIGFLVAGAFDFHLGIPSIRIYFWSMLGLVAAWEGRSQESPVRAASSNLARWTAGGLLVGLLATGVSRLPWYAAHAEFMAGVQAANEGNWPSARRHFEGAQRRDPHNVFYRFHRALAEARLALDGDSTASLERALALYQATLRQHPYDAFYHSALGWLYWHAGQFDRACAKLRDALQQDPYEPIYYVDLGWMLWQRGRWTEARQTLEYALSLERGLLSAEHFLGQMEIQQGHPEQAALRYRKILAHPPEAKWLRDQPRHLALGYGRVGVSEERLSARPHLNDLETALNTIRQALANLTN